MMHNFKTICLSALLLMTGAVSVSAQTLEKFFMDITGYTTYQVNDDGTTVKEGPVSVTTQVMDDYKFTISLPSKDNCSLNPKIADVKFRMQQVGSLGVKTRSYETTLLTGAKTNVAVKLTEFLKNTYEFRGAKCPVTVIDGDDAHTKAEFTYNINGIDENNKIVGTPDNSANAAKAWSIIARNNVQSIIDKSNDSHIVIKSGAYLRMGDQDLIFSEDLTLANGAIDFSEFIKAVKNESENIRYNELKDVSEKEKQIVVLFIPAGSVFQLGTSKATMMSDCTITIDLKKADLSSAGLSFHDVLKEFSQGTNNTDDAIQTTLTMFDRLVAMIQLAGEAPITVEFGPRKLYLLGDLNFDDEINVSDITLMVNIILGKNIDTSHIIKGSTETYNIANTNDHGSNLILKDSDGKDIPVVNVADVTREVNYILNKEDKEYIIVK